MGDANKNVQLPRRLRLMLWALRWRIRGYVLFEGLAAGVVWLGLTFWAGLALDYLPVMVGASEMPRAARVVLLVVIATVLAYVLYRWLLSRFFVRMADHSMAVLLERRFQHFHDALVTSVELAEQPSHAADFNQEMLDHTSNEALAEVGQVRLGKVFRWWPLASKVAVAILLIVPVGVFYAVNAQALELWVNRLYLLKDDPWPRQSKIEVVGIEIIRESLTDEVQSTPLIPFQDQLVKVARGSSINVRVHADTRKIVPDVCTIYYTTEENDSGRVTMKKIGRPRDNAQLFVFDGKPFRGMLSSIEFDVRGGDHRVRRYRVEVVDSPAVVSTELDCRFPAYMVNEQLSTWLPRTVDLTSGTQLPIGTEITVRCRANKDLRRVEVQNPNSGEITTIEVSPADAQRFEIEVPALDDSLTLDVTLFDTDGVISDRPHRIFIAGIQDQPPKVEAKLQGIGTAVTPDVLIPTSGRIYDDYDIAEAWFEVEIEEREPRRIPLTLPGDGTLDAELDFRLQRSLPDGVQLEPKTKMTLTIRAADRYDLGVNANVGSGDRYQFDVVTPDELLAALDRRELGLRRRFEQIIDEMLEMRDSLARIRTGADNSDVILDPEDKNRDDRPQPTVEEQAERDKSLRILRTQRALTQSQKSAQEVIGVAASFEEIRLELENNRVVDSEDRKMRLKTQIAEPLMLVADNMYPELDRLLADLEKALVAAGAEDTLAEQALAQTDDILLELDKVLQKMLELEDYNELVNLLRALIEDQQALLEQTKDVRKQNALDLLK